MGAKYTKSHDILKHFLCHKEAKIQHPNFKRVFDYIGPQEWTIIDRSPWGTVQFFQFFAPPIRLPVLKEEDPDTDQDGFFVGL
jgi:hypothetical protein